MWTNTASEWNRASKSSTFRSDIHRHFSLERSRSSCSMFLFIVVGPVGLVWALEGCAIVKNHSPKVVMIRKRLRHFGLDMIPLGFRHDQVVLFGRTRARFNSLL